jgi:hypothetical protein
MKHQISQLFGIIVTWNASSYSLIHGGSMTQSIQCCRWSAGISSQAKLIGCDSL